MSPKLSDLYAPISGVASSLSFMAMTLSVPVKTPQEPMTLGYYSAQQDFLCDAVYQQASSVSASAFNDDHLQLFADTLLGQTKDLPAEYSAVIEDHFWDLLL